MFNDAPFLAIEPKSDSPVFVFCDHATNHIPSEFNNLGLSEHDLSRHIAWDIGAETLTRQFCYTYGAGGLMAGFSRLLIDPNRAIDSPSLIPPVSDSLPIPGNQDLSAAQRKARIDTYYEPYHEAMDIALDNIETCTNDPLIISIHSFTPEMASGETRDLDIGLLWKVDESKALRVKAEIERIHPYKIALNEPYSALKLNFTMDRHVIMRGLRHITLEVRQDLIDTESKALVMAKHLTSALNHFIRR